MELSILKSGLQLISLIVLAIMFLYHRKLDRTGSFRIIGCIYIVGFVMGIVSFLTIWNSNIPVALGNICILILAVIWPLVGIQLMGKSKLRNLYILIPLWLLSGVLGFRVGLVTEVLLLISGIYVVVMGLTGRKKLTSVNRGIYNQMIFSSVSVILCAVSQAVYSEQCFTTLFVIISLMIILLNGQYNKIVLDNLTRLHNRYGLDEEFEEQLRQYKKDRFDSFCLIACDMDNFKTINDKWGHKEGDRALKLVAGILISAAEENDAMAFRNGGDEFVIITDKADKRNLDRICARIEKELSELHFRDDFKIKMSIGYAVFDGKETMSELLVRTDQFLYDEKRSRKKDEIHEEEC